MDKQFTKSDFKDGMVVTFRNRKKNYVIEKGSGILDGLVSGEMFNIANAYNDNLIHNNGFVEYDIMKVEYMGETLWERKEYVSFDVARKSGKKFKYWDWDRYIELKSVLSKLGGNQYDGLDIDMMLNVELWEIEP